MKLTPEQQQTVAAWVRDGASLSDVQKRLESDFNIRLTYMDVRFLIDDLNLELATPQPVFAPPPVAPEPVAQPGNVRVSLDRLARPGALVSGSVTFSDGITAQWHLDQMGRLALNPSTPGYQPSESDIADFQIELRSAIEKSGLY